MPRWYAVDGIDAMQRHRIVRSRACSQTTVSVANVERSTLVGDQVRVARTLTDRTVGLLGTRSLAPGEGLWIERSPSIHMFFMRFAIDAVFIAKDGRVTKIVRTSSPGGWCGGHGEPATASSSPSAPSRPVARAWAIGSS